MSRVTRFQGKQEKLFINCVIHIGLVDAQQFKPIIIKFQEKEWVHTLIQRRKFKGSERNKSIPTKGMILDT